MTAPSAKDQEGFAAFLLRARARGLDDKPLFSALESTPRRMFVPSEYQQTAFSPRMIPIDCGETMEGLDLQATVISALEIHDGCRVLEIGTGSGFTGAVMARLASRVITVDRFRRLVEQATERFRALGLANVIARHGNAHKAVEGEGPYDRIIVWAAFDSMPRHFVDLLSSGGVMIAPIGGAEEEQVLARLEKVGSRFERKDVGRARLQPLQNSVAAAL